MNEKTRRVRPSHDLLMRLAQFYGRRTCVVNGLLSADVHYHHLSRNPTETFFENLLPVSSEINGAIERNQDHLQVQPSFLLSQAQHLYRNNLYSRAYGCARLSAFLALDRKNFELCIDSCGRCIAYLRAIQTFPLMTDVISRSAIPATMQGINNISYLSYATFCEHVGNVLREQGMHLEFSKWQRLARNFLLETEQTSASQSLSIIHQRHASYYLLDIGKPDKAIEVMSKSIDNTSLKWEWDKKVTRANQGLWKARLAVAKGDFDEGRDQLHKLIRSEILLADQEIELLTASPLIGTIGTGIDVRSQVALHTLLAEIDWRMGRQDDALGRIRTIYSLLRQPPYLNLTRADTLPILDKFAAKYNEPKPWKNTLIIDEKKLFEAAAAKMRIVLEKVIDTPRIKTQVQEY